MGKLGWLGLLADRLGSHLRVMLGVVRIVAVLLLEEDRQAR